MKSIFQNIRARTAEIVIGAKYFLSSFYDKDGVWVEVLKKSTKMNACGWPSSVTYKVLGHVGDPNAVYYKIGKVGTCNATNLYSKPADASHSKKFPKTK